MTIKYKPSRGFCARGGTRTHDHGNPISKENCCKRLVRHTLYVLYRLSYPGLSYVWARISTSQSVFCRSCAHTPGGSHA